MAASGRTCPQRLFCHTYGRGRGQPQLIPDWPYSIVAALQGGHTSWTAGLNAVRLRPADDATAVTIAQVRKVVQRLRQAGHWQPGDLDILIVMDSGYDVIRLAFGLADLPVQMIGRLRSDGSCSLPHRLASPAPTAAPCHGAVIALAEPATGPAPQVATTTDTSR